MKTWRRQRWGALAAVTVLVGAGLGAGTSPVGAAADDVEQRSVSVTESGMLVEQITRGALTVTTYGSTGADVVWYEGSERADMVSVSLPEPDASDASAAQRSGDVDPTIYEMSLASGMSAAEACDFARGMDDYGCRTSSQVESEPASEPAARQTTAAAAGSMVDSYCYDFKTTKGDGSKHSHNCVTRYLDAKTSSWIWLAGKMKATGHVKNPGAYADRLLGVGIQLRYKNERSSATDWDPYSTESVGSCRDVGMSVEGRGGATYSSSSTVCPDKIGPWASSDFQYFGARWTSDTQAPADESRGVLANSVHKILRSGGTKAHIQAWLSWS